MIEIDLDILGEEFLRGYHPKALHLYDAAWETRKMGVAPPHCHLYGWLPNLLRWGEPVALWLGEDIADNEYDLPLGILKMMGDERGLRGPWLRALDFFEQRAYPASQLARNMEEALQEDAYVNR